MDAVDNVKLQIIFEVVDADGTKFVDAFYMTQEKYDAMTPEQFEAKKQERFDSWKANLIEIQNTPPPDPVEVAANIDLQIEMLTADRQEQVEQIVARDNITPEAVEEKIEEKLVEIKESAPEEAVAEVV